MNLKSKLLVVLLIPLVIAASVAIMLLSYLLVPMFIVLSVGTIIYMFIHLLKVKSKQ